MGAALSVSDRAYATRRTFRRRVSEAMQVIFEAADAGPIGVSYSGGKDSTVLLDLVRRCIPGAPAAHFDSGAEYPWTYDIVRRMDVRTITPEKSIIELARMAGHWGYDQPDPVPVDYDAFLLEEPADRFIDECGLDIVAIGIRGEESFGRQMVRYRKGKFYYADYRQCYHLCPLLDWTTEDIWAYISWRGLAYNKAYDRMAEAGIPREQWRVSTLLSYEGAVSKGRFVALRLIAPELFNQLAEEFPNILSYA